MIFSLREAAEALTGGGNTWPDIYQRTIVAAKIEDGEVEIIYSVADDFDEVENIKQELGEWVEHSATQ